MKQIATVFITAIFAVILLFVVPTYYIGIIQWRDDMHIMQNETRDLVDRVIDSGELTTEMIDDYNLTIASCSMTFSYEIVHEVPVINPGSTEGAITTSYVVSEDIYNWNTGDIITVKVKPTGYNLAQVLAISLIGSNYATQELPFAAMVR